MVQLASSSTQGTQGARRANIARRAPWAVALILTGVLLAALIVIPFIGVVIRSFASETPFDGYASVLSSSSTLGVLGRTLLFAIVTAFMTVAIGFPAAYGMTRVGPRARTILFALLVVPYLASVIVRTFSWVGVLGAAGPIRALGRLFGIDNLTLVGTAPAVLIALIHIYLPYVVLLIWISMRGIDENQIKAGQTLGARPLEVFWSVYAPQALPGVIAGGVLAFVITAGMVATPALIGGPEQSTVAQIISQQVTSGYGLRQDTPAVMAVLLTLGVFLILAVGLRFAGSEALLGVRSNSTRKAGRTHIRGRGFGRLMGKTGRDGRQRHWVAGVALAIAILIVDGPIVYLIGMSLQPLPLLMFPTNGISFNWYARVFSDPTWLSAIGSSLFVGVVATILAVIMAAVLAFATVRARQPWTGAIVAVALLPLLLPVVSFIPTLYGFYAGLGLIGNPVAIGFVHAVLALPYAYIPLLAALQSHDGRLEQASATLGASGLITARRVTVPLLAPAIVTAAVLAFVFSFDEFTATISLAGIRFQTLPLKFYAASKQNLSPELAAVGVLVIFAILLLCGLAALLVVRLNQRTSSHRESDHA